ncbi:MAG: hypothetical protein HQK54_09695, partial [Oligoflexales bacterium]|nr:hypothetical protein [Oligoflexales bacterium]
EDSHFSLVCPYIKTHFGISEPLRARAVASTKMREIYYIYFEIVGLTRPLLLALHKIASSTSLVSDFVMM